jgi:hypothetical protein
MSSTGEKTAILLLGLSFLSLHVAGMVFPDFWWTTHFLAFLGPLWKCGILLLATVLIVVPFWHKRRCDLGKPERILTRFGIWIALGVSLALAASMYAFPIVYDHYGDSYKVLEQLDPRIAEISCTAWQLATGERRVFARRASMCAADPARGWTV